MKKHYPYLQNKYFTNIGTEDKVARSILEDIEDFANQRQYIQITLLDWEENPIREIQGELSTGSLSKTAGSPIRRSANFSCAIDAGSYSVEDANADFAINKKIFIEIGIRNDTKKYPEYPVFWFPEGVFFIGSFSINSSSTGMTNINLTLKDKMAMLNGDVGGTLPAAVTFDTMDTQLPNGQIIQKKVPIFQIIQELVNHYGKESLNNIIIEDVPKRIRRILKWNGTQPIYLQPYYYSGEEGDDSDYDNSIEGYNPAFVLEEPENKEGLVFYNGDDIGYSREDFVITEELVGNAGESVCAILDKIINILGNYEYFYDVFGVFHFREIKNYLNHTLSTETLLKLNEQTSGSNEKTSSELGKKVLSELGEKDYLVEINNSKSVFAFTDKSLLTSITVTPKYENIKNDYIILGTSQTNTGVNRQVIYHLAIDKKPEPIGIDNRDSIYQLVDRTDAIAAVTADIENLNNELSIKRAERSRIKTLISTQEKKKTQRIEAEKKYGDLLKRQLALTLGSWAFPNNQVLSTVTLEKEDFYLGYEEQYYKEITRQNEGDDVTQYLSEWDDAMIRLGIDVSGSVLKFSEQIFSLLTPEGYWKIIKASKPENIKDIEDAKKIPDEDIEKIPNGLLQCYYYIEEYINYSEGKNAYTAALEKLNPGDDAYKVNINTGYVRIDEETIQTNEKTYIRKPQEIKPLKVMGDLPSLETICNEFNIESISKIYSDSYTLLKDDDLQKAQFQNSYNLAVERLENYQNRLEQLNLLIENWDENSTKPYVYNKSKNYYYSVNPLDPENDTNSEHSLKYLTVAEDLAADLREKIATQTGIKNNSQTGLDFANRKTSNKKYQEIWNSLHDDWTKYNAEKTLISTIEKNITTNTQLWKEGLKFVVNEEKNEIRDLIKKLLSKDYLWNEEGEGTVQNKLEEKLPEKIEDYSDKNKDVEVVYPNLVQQLQDIIEHWQQYPVYNEISNPRKGSPYYGTYTDRTLVFYEEPDTGIVKAAFAYNAALDDPELVNTIQTSKEPINISDSLLGYKRPEVGNFNLVYEDNDVERQEGVPENGKQGYFYWDGSSYKPLTVKGIFYYNAAAINQEEWTEVERSGHAYYIYDWRTALYLKGVYASILGTDQGYYYPELSSFWPETYDLVNQCFYGQQVTDKYEATRLTQGYYFLDFMDSLDTSYGVWSIDNIGRRTDVVVNDNINCLFEPEIPNVNILNAASMPLPLERTSLEEEWTLEQLRQESIDEGEPYTQVSDEIYDNILTGGYRNSAFEQLKYELYMHTRYQKSISATSIPVFYLEPNSRITIADNTTNTFGDFILQSINITFGPGANMSISATETLERF